MTTLIAGTTALIALTSLLIYLQHRAVKGHPMSDAPEVEAPDEAEETEEDAPAEVEEEETPAEEGA